MPINYKDYHPKWSLISRLIRFHRAQGKCEWCGVPNGLRIQWHPYAKGVWLPVSEGGVVIVLTVAHLDRNRDNNRFANLAALCQRCHLNHDRAQHIDNRRYGRGMRDQPKLF